MPEPDVGLETGFGTMSHVNRDDERFTPRYSETSSASRVKTATVRGRRRAVPHPTGIDKRHRAKAPSLTHGLE